MNNEIIFLGTGNALATRCFNTCFVICNNGKMMMVDAGGGNGILRQLELVGIERTEIQDLFVTHAHTDHILGVVWMMRMALQFQLPNPLRIWSHRKVLDVLTYICQQILPAKEAARIGTVVELHELHDGDYFEAAGMQLQCFDIRSTKELQYGFTAQLANGLKLVCLGDEPYNEANEQYVRGADWLMSEAFCLYADRDRFQPYEKHHSTVLDAARLATELKVKNLILYHTEDKTLETRRQKYVEEARSEYHGNVFVPDDLERIEIK
jgi:ribonuclease Z